MKMPVARKRLPPPRPGILVKRPSRVPRALLIVAGVCVSILYFVIHEQPSAAASKDPQIAAGASVDASTGPDMAAALPAREILPGMVKVSVPDLDVRPLFDRTERFKPGKAAKLRFAARRRATGSPASDADVSVSVIHAGSPVVRLPAYEVDEGVYETTFTPAGPGQYRLILSAGGIPLSSAPPVTNGAVGAVSAPEGTPGGSGVNVLDSLAFDPVTFRTRKPTRR
jgi:hypothetical protein